MTRSRGILIGAIVAIIAFLIGAGWQYTRARGLASRLDAVENQLAYQRLEGTLAAASIEAQRGNFERGRQLASEFFSGLQADVAEAPDTAADTFRRILSERDAMITALSRSNPDSGSRLATLLARYRAATGVAVPADSAVPAPTPIPVQPPPARDTAVVDTTTPPDTFTTTG